MCRRLFGILSALSLSQCVAACVMWVRSYQSRFEFDFVLRGIPFRLVSERGELWVDDFPRIFRDGQAYLAAEHQYRRFQQKVLYPDFTLRYGWSVRHGIQAVFFAMVPAVWIAREKRARRKPGNRLCIVCGYDLRATPDV